MSRIEGPPFRPAPDRPDSLAAYIQALATSNATGEFIEIDRHGRRHTISFGALFDEARRIRSELQKRQDPPEAIAIVCFESARGYVAAAWACLLDGRDFIPWDTTWLFTNPDEFGLRLGEEAASLPTSFVLADSAVCRALERGRRRGLVKPVNVDELSPEPGGEAPAASRRTRILVYTSGTGTDPKLAILDNHVLRHRFFDGFDNAGRVCLYNLAHHSVAGLRLLLPIGSRVVYLHPLRLVASPGDWLAAIPEFGVTDAGMSTSIASMICASMAERAAPARMDTLKRISFGAEVIDPRVVARLIGGLKEWGAGGVTVSFVYSMTETGPLFRSILPLDEALSELGAGGGPIALRNCVAGWRLRCVDETGNIVPQGTPGRVEVSSDEKLFAGYHGQSWPAGPGGRSDVWFDTGDVGILQGDRLTLTGREKSTIIVNARKVTCEEIEVKLSGTEGLSGMPVIAAPYRVEGQPTDAVAIFFVPPSLDEAAVSAIVRRIVGAVSKHFSLAARHVVPITADDIVRTATMKVKRDHLVRRYRDGDFRNLLAGQTQLPAKGGTAEAEAAAFLRLWQGALELTQPPRWRDNFFDLGGDSLAAVRLVVLVESSYGTSIAIDKFFEHPTPETMWDLVGDRPAPPPATVAERAPIAGPVDPLRGVMAFIPGWRGERVVPQGLLAGFNVGGIARPIFWVFQTYTEVKNLAAELGREQPLYAMRSAVGVVPTKSYSEQTLGPLLDRYLWEILVASKGRDFVIGGNCQGGIIALLLARRLQTIDRTPETLFLVDWWFDPGRYEGPTVVLMGKQESREHLRRTRKKLPQQFSQFRTHSVPGRYAIYFNAPNVSAVADRLRPPPPLTQPPPPKGWRALLSPVFPGLAGAAGAQTAAKAEADARALAERRQRRKRRRRREQQRRGAAPGEPS